MSLDQTLIIRTAAGQLMNLLNEAWPGSAAAQYIQEALEATETDELITTAESPSEILVVRESSGLSRFLPA